jgi:tetratricopeptide (TPR) repeat protein
MPQPESVWPCWRGCSIGAARWWSYNRRPWFAGIAPAGDSELRRLVILQRAYNHMNAGDLAVEKKENERALAEYRRAAELVPDSAEMVYWHSVALVNMGRLQDALPLFRRAFAQDKNWATLTPRLAKVGPLPDDTAVIQRIVEAGGKP